MSVLEISKWLPKAKRVCASKWTKDNSKWIELAPKNFQAHVWRSMARERLSDMPGARADAERAVALAPASFSAQLSLGQILMQSTEYQEAERIFEQLAQRYPNDDEAQIHYALALNTSASPADKTYASQLKGAAILEPIAKRQAQHPGVAHYLIHLYDYPAIAETLGITVSAARANVHLARERVRKSLEDRA